MNDFDDFDDEVRAFYSGTISASARQGCTYPKGMWTHLGIDQMELSHLINAERFARTKGWTVKADELASEIRKRDISNTEIVKRAFMLSESQLVAFAKASGFKIPKSGAGVYFAIKGQKFRITDGWLTVEYDRTNRIKKKKVKK